MTGERQSEMKFKRLEDLTDSEEEYHPNICTKSFNKFIKEENRRRLEELRAKPSLTPEETKEMEKLEYKFLPVDVEIPENSFRVSKSIDSEDMYVDELVSLLNDNTIDNILSTLDNKISDVNTFEEMIYFNLSSAIKEEDDDVGYELCKLGLLVKWAREYGRRYLLKIKETDASVLEKVFKEHYESSKNAILELDKE